MPERALRVAVLITEVDGSSMARCFTHYDYLEKTGRIEILGRWQVFDADVAVFHRDWKSDTLELIKSLQRQGLRVAVDVDDNIFELDPSNPAWHDYHQPEFRAAAKKVLKTADGLFVSTADLSEKYAHYSDHITVIPNALNLALWPAEMERAPRGTITLGFAGGASHLGDLDLLRGVLGPLLAQFHAKEAVHRAAQSVFGAAICAELDEGKLQATVRALRPHIGSADEAAKCATYIILNRRRMRYPEFHAQGLRTSTGVQEAGCKVAIGTRLKRAGMHWSVSGANAIIALRCAKLSGRFEDFWECRSTPLKAAA